jgi:polyisoprenoid-binding protein YceI
VSRFTASITLDRKEFGIDYQLPLGLGAFIIGSTVTVTLDIEAAKNI